MTERLNNHHNMILGFPWRLSGKKNSPDNAEDAGPVSG